MSTNFKLKLAAYVVLGLMVLGFGLGFLTNYKNSNRETAAAALATETTAATPASANPTGPSGPIKHSSQGAMIGYLCALVMAVIGLGTLIAYDVTQYVGGAAVDAVLDNDGQAEKDPDYEKAEQVWAQGKFLEAIQLMREYLQKNPRGQFAALRIAEIYEKDLNNPLAAALEYEEVLKKKLPAERWGWAAIHLCNLYTRLGQQEKAMALLQRIAKDYPRTAAAKKARSRLGLPEPEPELTSAPAPKAVAEAEEDQGENTTYQLGEENVPAPENTDAPKSQLPPGFRPKE